MAWILFSSGARTQYLENDVRALALLPGMPIQFRYEEDIVCEAFRKAAADGTIKDQTGYITYLDNRTIGAMPTFVLIREVKIELVEVRGSSYILKLIAQRYIRRDTPNLRGIEDPAAIRAKRYATLHKIEEEFVRPKLAKDEMPHPSGETFKGSWAAYLNQNVPEINLVAHDREESAHLAAFELTCNALELHEADFVTDRGWRKLFVNIIDIDDLKGHSVALPRWRKLKAGEEYRVVVYHYYREIGTHAKWENFWLKSRANSGSVTFRTPESIKIESEYDQKELILRLDPEMATGPAGFEIHLVWGEEDAGSVLDLTFDFTANARNIIRWARALSIAAGIAVVQFTTLSTDGKIHFDKASAPVIALIAGASLLAGICAVFTGFRRSV